MSRRSEAAFRAFAAAILSCVAKCKFRVHRNVIDMPDKGSLIICNHTSIWDFALLCYALRPISNIHFVATGIEFDKSRLMNWLFTNLGIIRKTQGAVDVMCVKEIIKAVRSGDNVALYAAGMTSHDGREGWSAQSGTGNLARLLKCKVYTVNAEGGFISHPRYAHRCFRGGIDVTVKQICTREGMSTDDYQKEINEAIRFNDWDWQEKHMVPFSGMKDMTGVSNTLYMCPTCKAEGFMSTSKGAISCEKCSFTARRDKYGFFTPVKGTCPKRMDRWVDMELDELRTLIKDDKLEMSSDVVYEHDGTEKKGCLRFTKDGFEFRSESGTLFWGMKEFQFLIMDDIDHLMFHTGSVQHRFRFEDPRLITRWFFAHRCLSDPDMR